MTKASLPHDVTGEELANWFGNKWKKDDHNQTFEAIAHQINCLRWPDDPPLDEDVNALEWKEDEGFWDFKAVAEAAQLLHDSMPKITAFWDNHSYVAEVAGIRSSLHQLAIELDKSLKAIVLPFGSCETRLGRPRCSKPWHSYALSLFRCIAPETNNLAPSACSVARNSILVRVIQRGLVRINVPSATTVGVSTLSQFLGRWDKFYGLPRSVPPRQD